MDLNYMGIDASCVYRNLTPAVLVEHALRKEDCCLTATGALAVKTGKFTGRAAKDKRIVDTAGVHEDISWGDVNKPADQQTFDALYERLVEYLSHKEVYVFDGNAGADKTYAKRFRIINELPSQNLFIHQLLIRLPEEDLADFEPDYTIIAAPGFKCDPERDNTRSEAAIIIDYEKHIALIAGSQYAGEIKKTVFSIMNYILPKQDVLPMHCSANIGSDGTSAIFFGLSGTGKTTLSADPSRKLIGDDEHGWSEDGVFNFEGGCYAKCIDLTLEREPDIYNAIRFGALVENVIVDEQTREIDFFDDSLTQNTRAGYPVTHIENFKADGTGGIPQTIIFLTADAFGVLPPISRLNLEQTEYYFLSGFTSKLAGTEIGINEPVPTFSTCFGEPFLPLNPVVYARMLRERVVRSGAKVYLVNTGWNGTGKRTELAYTRAMVTAALNGALDDVDYQTDPLFGFEVPTSCPGCPDELMIPKNLWEDEAAYQEAARKLATMFEENFTKKYVDARDEVKAAGPHLK